MDYGTGWLVSQSGQWVPVAYNASISETMPFRRASFTSLTGERTVASRGRGPREWEVEEDVIYDWAQALSVLYNSVDADLPMYWISPLAARSNYAINKVHNWNNKGMSDVNVIASDGIVGGSAVTVATNSRNYLTEVFPVKPGAVITYGATISSGTFWIEWRDSNNKIIAANIAGNASGGEKKIVSSMAPNHPEVTMGVLFTSGDSSVVKNPFVRIGGTANATLGVNNVGSEGAWVTLEDIDISHKQLNAYNPLVTAKFSLKECKGNV